MTTTIEELAGVREVFLDELEGDTTLCPNCGSYNTKEFQEYRTCSECKQNYTVLNIQRSTE